MTAIFAGLWALFRSCIRLLVFAVFLAVLVLLVGVGVLHAQRTQRETGFAEEMAPRKGSYVAAGDVSVFTQHWGPATGPLLVLVHGTGAWSGTWFALPETLAAQGWHVVAVDLPPFGMTTTMLSPEDVDYSRAAQARRLRAVLATLGGKATLVAHSFGAGPALEAAVQDSTQLNQLVLVDPALGLGDQGQAPECTLTPLVSLAMGSRTVRSALVGSTVTVPALSETLLKELVHRKEVVTPELVAPYQAPFARAGFSAALGDWAYAFARSNCEEAASLRPQKLSAWAAAGLPVSLIWGAEDTITPLAQAKSLSQWLPQAKLTVIPGVGHIPHIEDPKALAQALLTSVGPAVPAN